ncbi:DUF2863 family protein [Jeongeupia sp. HS-3]|uniref:DUF2863 family protein n=1 Tax=Jeongeupia sp. HS-3 TaxID=1009682 RepID=UPI001910A600|nr:DUF2863 family protein [Jeongeupia sp. HS-3]
MLKRYRPSRRGRSPADAADLLRLADGLAHATSRLEDVFWENQLTEHLQRLIADSEEDALNQALDAASDDEQGETYNVLADAIEAACEAQQIERDGVAWDVLLFAAPALAWSRWQIGAGHLADAQLQDLRVQLGAHVFSRSAKIALTDYLFSPDQLPRGYVPTAELALALGEAAFNREVLRLDTTQLPETKQFLSDTRYLIGAVVVPAGAAIFRWQEDDGNRAEALKQWQQQGGAALKPVLAGAAFELLLPGAYHMAWRNADHASRAYSLRATLAYLVLTLNLEPKYFQASIGPFSGRQLEEYRIGFSKLGEDQILHGIIWPLLDGEDETTDCVGEIEKLLVELGIGDVRVHEHNFPLDYCDDCGTPLYPNADGELLHPEVPEEVEQDGGAPQQLH